ncbi:hypothetical protein ABPG72_000601 [Tetrahymena utriculariae]
MNCQEQTENNMCTLFDCDKQIEYNNSTSLLAVHLYENFDFDQNANTYQNNYGQGNQHQHEYDDTFFNHDFNNVSHVVDTPSQQINTQQQDDSPQQTLYPPIVDAQEQHQYTNLGQQQQQQSSDNQLFDNQINQPLITESEDRLQQQETEPMFNNFPFLQNLQHHNSINLQNQYHQSSLYCQPQSNFNFYDYQQFDQQKLFLQPPQQQTYLQNYTSQPTQEQPFQSQLLYQFDFTNQNARCNSIPQCSLLNNQIDYSQLDLNNKNLECKQDISQYEVQPNKKIKVKEEQDIQITNQSHQIIKGETPKSYKLDGDTFNLKNFYKNIMKKLSQYSIKIFQEKGKKKIVEFIKKVFPCNKCNNKHFLMLFNHLQQNNDPTTSIVRKIEMDFKFSQIELKMLQEVREQAQKLFSNKFYYLTRIYKAHKASKNFEQFYYGAIFYAERATQQQFSSEHIPFKEEQSIFKNVQSDLLEKLKQQQLVNQFKTQNNKNNSKN